MSSRKEDILEKLNASAQTTERFFSDLEEEQLGLNVYADGLQWTVVQVLAHLVVIEKSMHRLFETMLQGGPGAPRDFDIERFNRSQTGKLDGLSREDLLKRFSQVRGGTIAMVEKMGEADLDREGWHPFHGHGRLERFVRWAYEHAALHVDDIRAVLLKARD
jgi:hypothetical protein